MFIMLSQTDCIRFLEYKLGFKFMDLEIEAKDIMEIIDMETLPEFSKYFPYVDNIFVNDADRVEGYTNRWYMRTETDIINVNRVIGLDTVNNTAGAADNGGLMFGSPRAGSYAFGNPIDSQLLADLTSLHQNPVLYHFYHPNIIEITPAYTSMGTYRVLVNCVHPKDLSTIPNNLRREFLNLALIDVAEVLYPLRTRFQNIQSTYGSIELLVDQLSDLVGRREEVIESFRNSSIKNPNRKKIWFA